MVGMSIEVIAILIITLPGGGGSTSPDLHEKHPRRTNRLVSSAYSASERSTAQDAALQSFGGQP
eukprot:14043966-Alexandrium_andersonii.AAC.1